MEEVLLKRSELKSNKYYFTKLNDNLYYLGKVVINKGIFQVECSSLPKLFNNILQNVRKLESLNNPNVQEKLNEKINSETDMLSKQLLETLLKIVQNNFTFFKLKIFQTNNIAYEGQCYRNTSKQLDNFLIGNEEIKVSSIDDKTKESIIKSYQNVSSIVDNIVKDLRPIVSNIGGKKSRKNKKSKRSKKSKSRKYKK